MFIKCQSRRQEYFITILYLPKYMETIYKTAGLSHEISPTIVIITTATLKRKPARKFKLKEFDQTHCQQPKH